LDNLGSELPADKDNIAGWLQALGYRTGFVGKSHIIDHTLWNPANWTAGGLLSYPSNVDPATDAVVNAAMQFNHRVIAQRHQPRGFDFAGGVYLGNLKEQYNDYLNAHNQEWITQYALQFIEENRSQRFFLYMAPTVNHGPIHSDLRYSLRAHRHYTGEGYITNPDYSFMPLRRNIIDEVKAAGKDLESARETWVDYSIAAIRAKLNEHNLLQDTLIIFTSDQGHLTLMDAQPLSGKSSLYDAGIAVPLVMHWPAGIASPGRSFNGLVQNVDIAPTLLALAAVEDLSQRDLNGVSLAPVLSGSNASVRSEVYSEIGYARAVRTLDWKLISLRYPNNVLQQIEQGFRWADHRTGDSIHPRPYYISNSGLADGPARSYPHYFADDQLYALRTDPRERNNLMDAEPAVWVDLKQRLSRYAGAIQGRPFGEYAPVAEAVPSAPTQLNWSFSAPNQLHLSWTDAASNELGFMLQQSLAGGESSSVLQLPTDSKEVVITLPAGIEDISFQLFAYNAAGANPAELLDLIQPENWRRRVFAHADPQLMLATSGWEGDPDGDGVVNLVEYAFALNPLQPDTFTWPQLRLGTGDASNFPEMRLPVDSRRLVDVTPLWSSDMVQWFSGEPHVSSLQSDGEVRLRSNYSTQQIRHQFLRTHFKLRQ
jgi:arylsulfatase A-like enzyme